MGCIAIFAANPSWTLVILTTAPSLIRSLAVGIATILYHVFGDVPAPILIGKLIDVWLKHAGEDEEKRYLAYYHVLQIVMFFSILLVRVFIYDMILNRFFSGVLDIVLYLRKKSRK